jgi:hypothetical protein
LIVSTSSGALRDPDIVRVTRDRINGAPADWVGLWSTRPWLEDVHGNLRWCGAPAPDGPEDCARVEALLDGISARTARLR